MAVGKGTPTRPNTGSPWVRVPGTEPAATRTLLDPMSLQWQSSTPYPAPAKAAGDACLRPERRGTLAFPNPHTRT